MNLNPFVFEYKHYPDCMLANLVSAVCSVIQKYCLLASILFLLVVIFSWGSNWGENLFGALFCFTISMVLMKKKEGWCESLAKREREKNRIN